MYTTGKMGKSAKQLAFQIQRDKIIKSDMEP